MDNRVSGGQRADSVHCDPSNGQDLCLYASVQSRASVATETKGSRKEGFGTDDVVMNTSDTLDDITLKIHKVKQKIQDYKKIENVLLKQRQHLLPSDSQPTSRLLRKQQKKELKRAAFAKKTAAANLVDSTGGAEQRGSSSSAGGAKPSTYVKRKSTADGRGEAYEYKMATLVFLRCLNDPDLDDFHIAANMDAAGAFDDLVVYSRVKDEEHCQLIQLKHKVDPEKTKLSYALLDTDENFSLFKYNHSFCGILESYGTQDLRHCGPLKNFTPILYTNAVADDDLLKSSIIPIRGGVNVSTGGEILCIKDSFNFRMLLHLKELSIVKEMLNKIHQEVEKTSGDEKRVIVERVKAGGEFSCLDISRRLEGLLEDATRKKLADLIQDLEKVNLFGSGSKFLEQLHIYVNQASEGELEALIKEELRKLWQMPDSEVDEMYHVLIRAMHIWWRDDKEYLTSKSHFWLQIVISHIDKLSAVKISEWKKVDIAFKPKSVQHLNRKLDPPRTGIVNVVNKGGTTFSSIKLYSSVCGSHTNNLTNIFVNWGLLVEREGEVLSAWQSRWCSALVVEGESEASQNLISLRSKLLLLMEKRPNLLLILVTSENIMWANTSDLRARNFITIEDHSRWSDLKDETQERLLKRDVIFQGTSVPFAHLV